jgi:hypothetical protein
MLKYIISRFLRTPDKTKTKQKNKDYEAVPAKNNNNNLKQMFGVSFPTQYK